MRTIGLYVNLHRERAIELARQTATLAAGRGLAVACAEHQIAVLAVATPGANLDDSDLIVTIGGDGTLLRGVRIAARLDVPVFGVNTGRLGFLTEIDDHDDVIAELGDLFDGTFRIEERVALHASVNGAGTYFALNDVVVRRASNARMAPFGMALDGQTAAHIPSDGIIVATPTGSTAYFLSAGGPIISPGVDALGIAALMPHTFFARPLLVPITSTIDITVDSDSDHANLDVDGTLAADLAPGDTVRVVRAPAPVKFARLRSNGTNGFFSRLEEKLQWGVPIKRESR
ncbi:MAG: NAD(+)/NADH kinase [Candidatus Velthaea sp.]